MALPIEGGLQAVTIGKDSAIIGQKAKQDQRGKKIFAEAAAQSLQEAPGQKSMGGEANSEGGQDQVEDGVRKSGESLRDPGNDCMKECCRDIAKCCCCCCCCCDG